VDDGAQTAVLSREDVPMLSPQRRDEIRQQQQRARDHTLVMRFSDIEVTHFTQSFTVGLNQLLKLSSVSFAFFTVSFLPARRYASACISHHRVSMCVCLSVCHTPVLYQNG